MASVRLMRTQHCAVLRSSGAYEALESECKYGLNNKCFFTLAPGVKPFQSILIIG